MRAVLAECQGLFNSTRALCARLLCWDRKVCITVPTTSCVAHMLQYMAACFQ